MTTPVLDAGDLARSAAPHAEAVTLPGAAYHDPEVFAWEQRVLFPPSWGCVGGAEELRRRGARRGGFCVAVDLHSAEGVGPNGAGRPPRLEALEPIRQGVRRHFGAFGKDVARGLSVRHDHGSQYVADVFQQELAFLGIESPPPSSAHPRAMAAPSASSGP